MPSKLTSQLTTELISRYQPAPDALDGKTLLITGAAGGLGSALALSASQLNCNLVLLDHNERALNALHDKIENITGKQPGLYPLDLAGANTDDYNLLAETIEEVFGGLHGLVHCAANLGQITPIASIDAKLWQKTFTVNLHGPLLLTQAVMPQMRATGNARIIFTTDEKRKAYWGAYGISKAAIEATVKTLSDELDSDRDDDHNPFVTCNSIDPGRMRTSFRSSAFPGEDPNELPLPASKVPAYLYLLSDEARTINGHMYALGDPDSPGIS